MRTHIAALERDGIIEQVGSQRDTGGKPARLYALTGEGEELFPKAYALVLGGLVEEIAVAQGHERAMELLSAVGRRVASGVPAFRRCGRSRGCGGRRAPEPRRRCGHRKDGQRMAAPGVRLPLSSVTARHPEVCALARTLVEEITGRPATECCERGERPRCCFVIAAEQAHQD